MRTEVGKWQEGRNNETKKGRGKRRERGSTGGVKDPSERRGTISNRESVIWDRENV